MKPQFDVSGELVRWIDQRPGDVPRSMSSSGTPLGSSGSAMSYIHRNLCSFNATASGIPHYLAPSLVTPHKTAALRTIAATGLPRRMAVDDAREHEPGPILIALLRVSPGTGRQRGRTTHGARSAAMNASRPGGRNVHAGTRCGVGAWAEVAPSVPETEVGISCMMNFDQRLLLELQEVSRLSGRREKVSAS